jgi:aminopeptidase-like protein
LDLVRPENLADSLSIYLDVIEILESNSTYVSLYQKCEPQLGRRGLYRALGGHPDAGKIEMALLWVLNMSDGRHSLLDIAERSELPYREISNATKILIAHDLLKES